MSKKTTNPLDEEIQGGSVDLPAGNTENDLPADVQFAADMAHGADKRKPREKKQLTDKEIVDTARRGEQLSPEDHERLRFIPGPNGENGAYKDLWTRHEFRYGPKVEVYIPLAAGEADERFDKEGNKAYPMEFTSISGVRCFVPKGVDAEIPKIVADVLKPFIRSLHPRHHEMRNISAPTFRFE